MSVEFTVFDLPTGAVVSNMMASSHADALLNVDAGQALVEGVYAAGEWRLISGVPVAMPPRPAPYFTFDYAAGVWIDPRTPAEYAAYVLGVRQAARAPKIDFLRALVLGGAFSNDDIVDLAVGYFPASVKSSLNSLTPAEVLDLQLAWVSSTEVGRLDATITHVAAALGTSDEDLDALFGITLDPPPAE